MFCANTWFCFLLGGLCYQGFVEAFIQLASKKFRSNNNFDAFQALLEHCEVNLGENTREKKQPRIISGRGQLFPSINKSESWQDDKLAAYKRQSRKKHSTAHSYFLDYRNFTEEGVKNPLSIPKPTLIRTKTNIVRTGPGRFKKVHSEPVRIWNCCVLNNWVKPFAALASGCSGSLGCLSWRGGNFLGH